MSRSSAARYAGKIVLIGSTAAGIGMASAVPAPVKDPDAAVHADNGFDKTLPAAGLPGYDAAENDRHTREAQPGPLSALHTPGAPEMPQAGGGKAGREP